MYLHIGTLIADHHEQSEIGNYQRIDFDPPKELQIFRKPFDLVISRNGVAGDVYSDVAPVSEFDRTLKIGAREICDGCPQRKLLAPDIHSISAVFDGVAKSRKITCGSKQFRFCNIHIAPQKNSLFSENIFHQRE